MTKIFTAALAALIISAGAASAEWKPKGPIKLWIGFGAGGGTDTQGRALAEEIEKSRGWRVIPENKAGAGGAVMAAQLKNAPADGQTIGFAITSTVDFASINNKNLSVDDFTYITTTAGSQTGVIARKDSGWKSLEDMVKAAKSGTKIVWSNWGPKMEAASETIARHYGISVNHLRAKGGKGTMNALVAKDANVAWSGGAHRSLVAAGEVVILASAEAKPLAQAPKGKTLVDYGMDLVLANRFLIFAPKGLPNDARDAIAKAITEVLSDPNQKVTKYVQKRYPPGPVLVSGEKLVSQIKANLKANKKLLESIKK
jgi:tripartite-type tricarboxylate transporter receptor subunit TctC